MADAPESPRERANREQLAASDPAVSAFVGASAGSGKTKLLTDRLLRLMMDGVRPDRIQCLTFTKAAAAEMSLRLQRTLGRWVRMSDAELAAELDRLQVKSNADALRKARELFAQVLDLPGGMRIGTIHAFSQSLLRRFPLEAAISPHFQLVDDRDAEDAMAESREDMLAGARESGLEPSLHRLAALSRLEDFASRVKTLTGERERLDDALKLGADLGAAQRRALEVTAESDEAIVADAVHWMAEHELRLSAERVAAAGSPGVRQVAQRVLDWFALDRDGRARNWDAWTAIFRRADGDTRAPSGFVNRKLHDSEPTLVNAYLAEANRIETIEDSRRALRAATVSYALARLAGPIARGYRDRKNQAGWLDFSDLIGRTWDLLREPGAAWVLYKLDGGLDHLLLDEVQDTAPEQWRIALALTEEFFVGLGARDARRTVFAVGDPKQSIYSFQGADMATFVAARARLARRVEEAGEQWRDVPLDVSFRSTEPVLRLVDAVFADPTAAKGVVDPGASLSHHADRADHAGIVELWPLAPRPPAVSREAWTVPHENHGRTSAPQLLAEGLADWIREQTAGGVMLESRGRPLSAGDVMVLVRRRDEFARTLVRALKSRGVPVAGLDRMVLTEQPAVQDLMALCDALLLPNDDLTFACVLTSPLGGFSDDDLMALAVGRTGSLWEALRARADERPSWRRLADFFAALLSRVDYATPHALLAEALGPLGGRARLFARLGAEAADPIDELLNTALTHASLHPPSLQGFLHWLRLSGAEVKREPEAAGDLVRVMTVHGAKGLQAPLVILPDTTGLPPPEGGIVWARDPATDREVPILAANREHRCEVVKGLQDRKRLAELEEYNRQLYVALTRAEDRLVVCGWEPRRALNELCWYAAVSRAFDGLTAETETFAPWSGEVRRLRSPQRVPVAPPAVADALVRPALPAWLGSAPAWRSEPPPPEPVRPRPLAPSRPEGVEMGAVPAAASPLALLGAARDRFRRGRLIHTLLQHLPDLDPAARADAATRYLDRPGHDLSRTERAAIVREVLAILDHPELAPLFGPAGRSEVPLTGVLGQAVVGGLVDRLVVLPDRVLLADFKTNRQTPARVEDTPPLYLRQMAVYRAVLRGIFPDRPVRCALIWTREGRVAMLPDDLLDARLPEGMGEAHG